MMKKIDVEQGTADWLEWRSKGITATDIPAIMGKSPFKTALDVYNSKNSLEQAFVSEAMKRGIEFEQEAREMANKKFEMDFVPGCYEHGSIPWARASLDGIYKNTVLEIKVPMENNFGTFDEVPFHYMLQMQWQMFVTGAQEGIYFVYSPELKAAEYFLVERDQELIEEAYEKGSHFFFEHILKEEPPVTLPWNDSYDLIECFTQYKEAAQKEREWHAKKEEIRERLLEAASFQECKTSIGSIRYITTKKLDHEKLSENGIDLDQYKTQTSNYWKIDLA